MSDSRAGSRAWRANAAVGWVIGVGLLFLAVAAVAILPVQRVPDLTEAELDDRGIDDAAERLTLEEARQQRRDDVRATLLQSLLQSVAGLALLWGGVITWKTLGITRQKEETNRFAKAAELLGHDNRSVKTAGLFALGRMVDDDEAESTTVVDLLSAYVREHAPRREPSEDDDEARSVALLAVRLPDVQAAIEVLGRISRTEARASLPHVDLARADLTDADLPLADLTGADLTDAKLTDANLTDADLTDAFLTRAELRGADLTDADLTGADLTGATLTGATLTRANLWDANLTGAELSGLRSTRTGAKISGFELWGADLTGANLINADLTRATLTRATLTGATLWGANLWRADLTDATLTRANLWRANLTGAFLIRANLTDANLTDANLTDARLTDARLTDANLTGANLSGARADVEPRWPEGFDAEAAGYGRNEP
jgi:uncharacterized protein YjbI with pentapeptide repeats